jgi:hypothetical protein
MTARSVAAIAKPVLFPVLTLVLLSGAAACTAFYEIPIETPIQPKMDVSMFQRVLIAGFIGGGTDDVDANLETVRLLRSQLRSKSSLRVIEAEVLQLANIAREQGKAEMPAPAPGGAADGQQPQTPSPPPAASTNGASEAEGVKIRNEKDLEKYQSIFADVQFWKKIGEECSSRRSRALATNRSNVNTSISWAVAASSSSACIKRRRASRCSRN